MGNVHDPHHGPFAGMMQGMQASMDEQHAASTATCMGDACVYTEASQATRYMRPLVALPCRMTSTSLRT